MDRKRTYSAFTLVEMLIVMGIVIILMAVGITAGRYAINRANDVAHRNAVDQIYQALQAFYADERAFPYLVSHGCTADTQCTPEELIGTSGSTGILGKYMDSGAFDGGTDASYYYAVDDLGQSVLVCVTLGGHADATGQGIYCNGNGFNDNTNLGFIITDKDVEVTEIADYAAVSDDNFEASNWLDDTSSWTGGTFPVSGS